MAQRGGTTFAANEPVAGSHPSRARREDRTASTHPTDGLYDRVSVDISPGSSGTGESTFLDSPPMAEKVDPDDLIGAAEVQAILGLSHPSSVTTYLRRYSDFPNPVVDLSGSRVRLWKRQDIVRWHESRGAAE